MSKDVAHYSYGILSLEASFIYNCMHLEGVDEARQEIPAAYLGKGAERYHGQLDMNLETIHMEKEGLLFSQDKTDADGRTTEKANRFMDSGKHYTDAFINVSFGTAYKSYNTMYTPGGIAFVKAGYLVTTNVTSTEKCDFNTLIKEHILIKDSENGKEIVAIEIPYKKSKKAKKSKEEQKTQETRETQETRATQEGQKAKSETCEYIVGGDFCYTGLKDEAKRAWKTYSCNSELSKYFEIRKNGNGRSFFAWKMGKNKESIKAEKNTKELRLELYQNGFVCNGRRYVRYKRSAGSGREGNCLFIEESLLAPMMEWNCSGFIPADIRSKAKAEVRDLTEYARELNDVCIRDDATGWEAYSALTLSSVMADAKGKPRLLNIRKNNILVIPDAQASLAGEKLMKVKILDRTDAEQQDNEPQKGKGKKKPVELVAEELSGNDGGTVTVDGEYNAIWDGQAMLDDSLFTNGLENNGMMLLRNRFFKSCAFRTKLQDWFKAQGVNSPEDLAGFVYPKPEKLSDIKMVVTPSSIKYLKFWKEKYGIRQETVWDEKTSEKKAKKAESGIGDETESLLDKAAICAWLQSLDGEPFGVVKTDKPTGYFDGKLVSTNYQLINTLELNEEQAGELLRESFDYLKLINKDTAFLAHYLKLTATEEEIEAQADEGCEEVADECELQDEDTDSEIVGDSCNFMLKLLENNPAVCHTESFTQFMKNLNKTFREKLSNGRILINGNYETLFGNGAEMLTVLLRKEEDKKEDRAYRFVWIDKDKHLIDPEEAVQNHIDTSKCEKTLFFEKPVALNGNEIYTKRFADGAELVCERSPHITMGNLLRARNRHHEIYTKYFNFTNEIVCINSINNDIMERLNGCDFDSDTMLVTDNRVILENAHPMAVPVKMIHHERNKVGEGQEIIPFIAEMDDLISNNKVGEIVNLSQVLNSIYWTVGGLSATENTDNSNVPEGQKNINDYLKNINVEHSSVEAYKEELYRDICILSVMSGIEIDKAKRKTQVDCGSILKQERNKHKKIYLEYFKAPAFFAKMTGSRAGSDDGSAENKTDVCTAPMAQVYSCVKENGKVNQGKRDRKKEKSKTTLASLAGITAVYGGDERVKKVLELCDENKNNNDRARCKLKNRRKRDDTLIAEAREEKESSRNEFVTKLGKLIKKDPELFDQIIIGIEIEKGCLHKHYRMLLDALTSGIGRPSDGQELTALLNKNSKDRFRTLEMTETGDGEELPEGYHQIYSYWHRVKE